MSSFHSLKIVDVPITVVEDNDKIRISAQKRSSQADSNDQVVEVEAHTRINLRLSRFELQAPRLQCSFTCGGDGDTTHKNHINKMRFPSALDGSLIRYALNKSIILRLRFPLSHKIVVLLQKSRYEFVPDSIIEVTVQFVTDGLTRWIQPHTAGVSIHTICTHEALGQVWRLRRFLLALGTTTPHSSISKSPYLPELFRRERIGHVAPLRPLARQ